MSTTKTKRKKPAKTKRPTDLKDGGGSKKIEQEPPSPGKKQRSSVGKKKVGARSAAKKKGAVKKTLPPGGKKAVKKQAARAKASAPATTDAAPETFSPEMPPGLPHFNITNEAELARRMVEVVSQVPIFPAILPYGPMPARREKMSTIELEVQDENKKHLAALGHYPRGQHVVAIVVPVKTAQEVLPWLMMNKSGEYLASIKPSDYQAEFEVSTGFMADALGMTSRNLQHIARRNPHIKLGHGRYDLIATFKAYLSEIIDEYKGRGGKEYSDARTRGERLKNEEKELNLAEKSGALVPVADVNAVAFKTGIEHRRALENLPSRINSKLTPIGRRALAKEIKITLNQLDKSNTNKPSTSTTTRKQRTNESYRRTQKQARKSK